jgi:hypothetical protein
MKRSDFAKNKKSERKLFRHDTLNNGNIRVYINDKYARGVQLLRIEASMTNGFVRAHVKVLRFIGETNQVEILQNVGPTDELIAYDEINPNLDGSLIVEKIEPDGKWTNFYLRKIIEL